jgi:predicted RNA binding protein YcfA (HicA-like mRNA interferase family)
MKSGELIRRLKKDGWVLRGGKGSHHIFTHPIKNGHIVVPHPRRDLGIGLIHAILKQAQLTGL